MLLMMAMMVMLINDRIIDGRWCTQVVQCAAFSHAGAADGDLLFSLPEGVGLGSLLALQQGKLLS